MDARERGPASQQRNKVTCGKKDVFGTGGSLKESTLMAKKKVLGEEKPVYP